MPAGRDGVPSGENLSANVFDTSGAICCSRRGVRQCCQRAKLRRFPRVSTSSEATASFQPELRRVLKYQRSAFYGLRVYENNILVLDKKNEFYTVRRHSEFFC